MKNNFPIILIFTFLMIFAITACQPTTTGNVPANSVSVNKPIENTQRENINSAANQPVTEAGKTPENNPSPTSADTPTAAYKAAYKARKDKDIKALKQLISKDMVEFFTMMGEGKPNPLDEGLKQLVESPQGASDEVRNEKINGDKATLEYLDKNGAWKSMNLVKENGSWKLDA